jgi:hypothetical protein
LITANARQTVNCGTDNWNRKDWANAGRNLVVRDTGIKTAPLLHATLASNIESVEWFLGDAPFRHYTEFGQSKTALADPKLKHLGQTPGAFDRALTRWLGAQSSYTFNSAISISLLTNSAQTSLSSTLPS